MDQSSEDVETPVCGHILVAGNEFWTLLSLSLMLREAGFHVSAASDGRQALRILRGEVRGSPPVDLLIADGMMPDAAGLEVLECMSQEGLRLPVLVIRGSGSPEARLRVKEHGAADYLEKPFDAHTLLERVRALLSQAIRYQGPTPSDGSRAVESLLHFEDERR